FAAGAAGCNIRRNYLLRQPATASGPALTQAAPLFTMRPRSRRSEEHGYGDHSRDRRQGAAISFERAAWQALDRADQAADHTARSVTRLFAGCRLPLPAYPSPAEC